MRWYRRGHPYAHVRREKVAGYFYRSGAERAVGEFLSKIGWEWEHEPKEFEFPIKRGTRFYTPDYMAWPKGKPEDYKWIEVKGWMDQKSGTKLKRVMKYHPDEAKRLVIVTDWPGMNDWVQRCVPIGLPLEVWSLKKVTPLGGHQ